MTITFANFFYTDLSRDQLYDVLALRSQVFVVEQECFYHDPDGLDKLSHHILAMHNNAIVGCARIVPAGKKSPYPAIGRYLLAKEHRGAGQGRQFFMECVRQCRILYPHDIIYVQAQQYLEAFYASFGFETIKGPYIEAGIPHVDMHLVA